MRISRSMSMPVWIVWHLIAAVIVVAIPSQLRTGRSLWDLDADHVTFLLGTALTYLVCAFVLAWRMRKSGSLALSELTGVFLAVFGTFFLYLLITESFYSRTLLSSALILSVLFMVLSFMLPSSMGKVIVVILVATTAWLQALGPGPTQFLVRSLDLGPKPGESRKIVNTMLYTIEVASFKHYFDVCLEEGEPCRKPGTGGGIESFGDGYLLVTGDGDLHYLVREDGIGALHTTSLPYRVPINTDEFVASGLENRLNVFRVTDILVRDKGGTFELFAAYLYWKSAENCVVLRVSRTEADYQEFLTGTREVEWRTLYDAEPCLPSWKGTISGEHGGRMVLLGNGKLLLTVGHSDFDGVNREAQISQDMSAAYGKTMLIDPLTGEAEVYSLGHRNPQGLFLDKDGTIWSTEHGPRGGDELNIVVRNANYGWPLVTHGTQYGMHTWPITAHPGRHDGFRLPVFAWVPSIAVSSVIGVRGESFPLWEGDLLVASFKKALYRLRVREGRVVYVESIKVPGRIRDLIEGKDGQVLLYLDSGTVMYLRPVDGKPTAGRTLSVGEHARGELLFASCSGCHALADGSDHGIGPDLAGVLGREIAGATGYSYSSALSAFRGRWTEGRLDEFLADPQTFAPGTSMMFEGMSAQADRKALIDFLKSGR